MGHPPNVPVTVVDPILLTNDIVANVVSLVLPAGLWAFLFLFAWEHAPFAESIGLGRRAFWLLLPGALLATFAILPFGAVSNDIVAVSFGGAIFPLLVGALAIGRAAPPRGRLLGEFLLVLAIEGGLLLLLVLPLSAPLVAPVTSGLGGNGSLAQALLLLPVLVLAPPIAFSVFGQRESTLGTPEEAASATTQRRALLLLLAIVSGVLFVTFLASQSVPGLGIVEPFPLYLLPPIGAGVLTVLLAPRIFPRQEGFALPVAYLATTFGVLLGADLLRQPPLYGTGSGGLYTIGGAGVLDLVYLSGLIALATAYLVHRALARPLGPVGSVPPAPSPTPFGRLARAFRAGVYGQLEESLGESDRAAREAADQARRLTGLPPAPVDRPWEGLPVPGWVVSDQANLDAVARGGTRDGREGFRAWLTARALVVLGRDLGQRRFGSVKERVLAFVVDLALVGVPAAAVWSLIVLATPGDLNAVLASLPFNAAIYGFVALSFLYLVLSETLTGSSLGKRWWRLSVRDRSLRPVGFLSALVRNASVLPALTVLGLGGALAVAFGLKAGTYSAIVVGGISLPSGLLALTGVLVFVVGGIGLFGVFGVLAIGLSSERQRLGDLWAGTWVVRGMTTGTVGGSPTSIPSGVSPPATGADRSE